MINEKRLADTFTELVRIDSVSRHEKEVSEAVCRMLSSFDPEIYIDGAGAATGSDTGNLIMRIPGTSGVPPLMLNAHMDTVEPGIGVEPVFSGGVFTSRGDTVLGSDDKSAIAIIIEALHVVRENRIPCGPLELVFTICEEIGLLGAKNLDFSLINSDFGYALDSSDTDSLINRAPAANHFEINVLGRDAHAGADPERGINAVFLAGRALSKLTLGRIDPETTCNIGFIEGGGPTNVVPRHARVRGEARSHDDKKLVRVTEEITGAFESAAEEYRSQHGTGDLPSVDISVTRDFSSTNIPDDHTAVRLAVKAGKELGREIGLKSSGGGSDANIFYENGIAAAVIGTGMTDIHSTRESIRLSDMVKSSELVVEIIRQHALASGGGGS